MVFFLLEMCKTLVLLIVFISFNGVLNAKQYDQTTIKIKSETGTSKIANQTNLQNNFENLNIEKLKQNQSCEHKTNNTDDNFPEKEVPIQVRTSLLGTNVKFSAVDEVYIKIRNETEKNNSASEIQNNSKQNSELDDGELVNVRGLAHPSTNDTTEESATNIEVNAATKSEESYQTTSFGLEYPENLKTHVVNNNEKSPEKQNYWVKRITTPDPVDKEIKQILNYLPKLPELTFSDNKSHFEFHKDPEESALDERVTQIARQLAETSLRREFEEKKLGHYISIRLANFDDDHQSRPYSLSKKSKLGKSYKIPTEFFPKNTQQTIIMPIPLTRRFGKQQFQSIQSTTAPEVKIQSSGHSGETDSNKAHKIANDKYHLDVTDFEVLPVSFYLRFKYLLPILNNLERYNVLFAHMNTHQRDR